MPERSNGHAWKACVQAIVPWVRIPLHPPLNFQNHLQARQSLQVVFLWVLNPRSGGNDSSRSAAESGPEGRRNNPTPSVKLARMLYELVDDPRSLTRYRNDRWNQMSFRRQRFVNAVENIPDLVEQVQWSGLTEEWDHSTTTR